jgi:hypothetical protein
MAMGSKGRREAENAIGSCRPFRNSTGSFYGTRGSTRTLGWLESHTEARRIRELLSRAVYVVWSYGTPIAFVSETEDGERTAYYVDESHSTTTSHHQGVARIGMGEYETIGAQRPVRRPRRQVVGRPQTASAQALGSRLVTNHRGVQYDPLVERDTSYERDMAEERMYARLSGQTVEDWRRNPRWSRPAEVPADSPGYQNGRSETEQESTLQRLLDPRYADPDWVPNRDWDADLEAERRDIERVEREGAWRP